MEETVFPPSPSWFLPNIISTREDGSLAYGSKNNVVIFKLEENKKMNMSVIQDAHLQRITSVAFSLPHCHESVQNTLVSGAEDGFVKLWKLESLIATIGHKCHAEEKGEIGKILSIDWNIANPHHIISAADNNSIVLWDILSNSTMKFSFPKLGITVISCCPFSEKLIAAGGKSGQIYIISLKNAGDIIYKLRGHDNKIHTLSWCPVPYNVFETNEVCEEFLLASACQNREVYIWRVGSDAKCETKFVIPTNALSKKVTQQCGKLGNTYNFSIVNWLEPYKIFSSSSFGELIYFDVKFFLLNKIPKGEKIKQKSSCCFKLGHYFHSKGLFAAAGAVSKGEVILYEDKNIESELMFPLQSKNIRISKKIDANPKPDFAWEAILEEYSPLLWTAGQDRKVVACEWNTSKMQVVLNYHTMNGFVYCAVVSPLDPNIVAIGVGDGMIRLWNLTDLTGEVQTFWQKIKDRVMSLDWHPTKDGILAYGTSEGRVGLIDTKSSKPPNVFKPSHSHPIYSLSWGPKFNSSNLDIVVSNMEFDLYAVGDNTLSLYSTTKLNMDPLNLSKIIIFPCKKQTDVHWKPDFSIMAVGHEDGSISLVEPREFKVVYTVLAYKKLVQSIAWHPTSTYVDSGRSPYHGYFTSGSTDNDYEVRVFDCKKENTDFKVELVATLKGHQGHIQSVSWSPHIGGQLVSTSLDGSVQIWDVISQVPLFNYTPQGMPIFSVWSPIDPDFVFTGCRNDVLYVWKTSACTKKAPSAKMKTKRTKKDTNIQLSFPKEVHCSERPPKSSETVPVFVAESKIVVKNSKEAKIFSKIWQGDTNEELSNCYSLLKSDKEKKFLLPFLCSDNYFKESVKAEEEFLKKLTNWNEYYELALWNGRLSEVINEKIVSGQLNDFLVSLAPTVSHRIWQEACYAYSKTLTEKKFYRKAASYLIICHKIYEAINLLVNANLYLEAFCIARNRLPQSDPILNDIIKKYAGWLFENGSFLKACECYIYLEEYQEVAKILGKKSQAEYLRLAALAAQKYGSFDIECLDATNAVFKCLEANNFKLANQICEDHTNLKHISLIVFVYEELDKLEREKLSLSKDFISYIKEFFDTKNVTFPKILPKLFHKYTSYKNKRQMLITVAQELCFAACSEDTQEVICHITKALSTCCRYIQNSSEEVHPLYKLCCWLAPEKFLAKQSFFSLEYNATSSMKKSVRAFLCAAIVRHLSVSHNYDEFNEALILLNDLKEELLDFETYKYFQNLIEVEVYEKRLLKSHKRTGKDILTNGKNDESTSEVLNDVSNVSERLSEYEEKSTESEISFNFESEKKLYTSDIIENNCDKLVDQLATCNLNNVSSNNAETETNSVNYLSDNSVEENIKNNLEIINRLKSEIEHFESTRISSPNPIPVYFMLKKILEKFPDHDIGTQLTVYLDNKWKELN